MFDECFLQGVELVAFCQPLDCENVFAFHPDGELAAGVNVSAVDNHGAGAALAAITADLRAREAQFVAQHLGQRAPMFHLNAVIPVIDFEAQRRFCLSRANRLGHISLGGIGSQKSA